MYEEEEEQFSVRRIDLGDRIVQVNDRSLCALQVGACQVQSVLTVVYYDRSIVRARSILPQVGPFDLM